MLRIKAIVSHFSLVKVMVFMMVLFSLSRLLVDVLHTQSYNNHHFYAIGKMLNSQNYRESTKDALVCWHQRGSLFEKKTVNYQNQVL